jgi:hypothetical protein
MFSGGWQFAFRPTKDYFEASDGETFHHIMFIIGESSTGVCQGQLCFFKKAEDNDSGYGIAACSRVGLSTRH